MTLPSVAFESIPLELLPTADKVSSLPRQQKRIAQLLAKGSANDPGSSTKKWSLDFLLSPQSFNASDTNPTSLDSSTFSRNEYRNDADHMSRNASIKALADAQPVTQSTNLAFRSVGYKSVPLPTLPDVGVPFNPQRGIIPNDIYGRVLTDPEDLGAAGAPQPVAKHVPGMYCAGWVKRGPTGVIASTMEDAFATADAIAADYEAGAPFLNTECTESTRHGWDGLQDEARAKGLKTVSWDDWKRIDQTEKSRGNQAGKEREKITRIDDMLKAIDS
jgi:adrenodoxin-NADP+ reductase